MLKPLVSSLAVIAACWASISAAAAGEEDAGKAIRPCVSLAGADIRPGDMADNILDREKHPEWNGERTKMVYHFPANEKLWAKYAEVRAESLRIPPGRPPVLSATRGNVDARLIAITTGAASAQASRKCLPLMAT